MDGLSHMAPNEREFEIDLESGGNTEEEDSSNETDSTAKVQERKTFSRVRSGFTCFSGSINRGCNFASSSNLIKNGKLGFDESKKLLTDSGSDGEKGKQHVSLGDKKRNVKEKIKKNGNVHKPPRPPKGPSLDASDRILVKEMTELALKKRATVERIRTSKKMRVEKASSFTSSLPALLITLLFFVVIIFQGMSAKGSAILLDVPSTGGTEGFITVQHLKSSNEVNRPHSHFLNTTEKETSDLGVREENRRKF